MDRNIKKGFTLVELAIVLVVIGILLGLVLKGKSVIDAANARAEIASLSKIRTAVQSYFTKYERVPGLIPGSTAAISSKNVYDALINDELLSPKDFTVGDDEYWAFIGCTTFNIAGGNNKKWDVTAIKNGSSLCVYLTNVEPDMITNVDGKMKANRFDGPFICQVESSLDDMDSYNGLGRLLKDENESNGVGKGKYTCNDADVRTQTGVDYVYKVK